jgi:APA family basic amino acid/polyamine antiporter
VWPVAIGGILSSSLLMVSLPSENWLRLFIWFAIGMAIYFVYGYRKSKLRQQPNAGADPAAPINAPDPPPPPAQT